MIMTHAKNAKDATQIGILIWTAAGSEAPRRFCTHGARRLLESGVAAALCHRSPKRAAHEKSFCL